MKRMNSIELHPDLPSSTESVKLTVKKDDGTDLTVDLPVLEQTIGKPIIDVRALHAKTGHFTFDPGFGSTCSCTSKISHIDGVNGTLTHRGYKIEDLFNNCSYIEVSYLLLYGELPSKNELRKFEQMIVDEMCIHTKMVDFFQGFKSDAHPMAIMVSAIGTFSAFSTFVQQSYEIPEDERDVKCIKMIAKMPMIAALAYRSAMGLNVVYPDSKLSYMENFLRMMFKNPSAEWTINQKVVEAMDKIFILHAVHGQCSSTTTVRIAASSNANPYACISAGVSSLWGPLHGGADEVIVKNMMEMKKKNNVDECIARSKDKNDNYRLMGFGHRVYKLADPRSILVKNLCIEMFDTLGIKDPLFDFAVELEEKVSKDEYFVKRKLYANLDYYTGMLYRILGVPTNMFTVIFACARVSGWMAHWKESIMDTDRKIGRPRQLFVGHKEKKDIVPLDKRNSAEQAIKKI